MHGFAIITRYNRPIPQVYFDKDCSFHVQFCMKPFTSKMALKLIQVSLFIYILLRISVHVFFILLVI